ncbi:MAG: hypothetical protein K0S34_293 [Bacillales bacterium]|jgi:hypothetical protein|nr:hypothetical protein [Bacillales bacterium]
MNKYIKLIAVSILSVSLSGCFENEKEVKKEITSFSKTAFNRKGEKPNYKGKGHEFFLPKSVDVEKAETNNYILNGEGGTYLLFINPNEDKNSNTLHKILEEQKGNKKEYVNLVTNDTKRYEYLYILKDKEENYEIYTGIGGIKISGLTSLSNVEESVHEMTEILISVNETSKK